MDLYPTLASNIMKFIIAVLLTTAHGAKLSDQISYLPGYGSNLPSKQYSGYFPVGKLSGIPGHLHYWFIESEVRLPGA